MSGRLTILIFALVSVGAVVFAWLLVSSPPETEKPTAATSSGATTEPGVATGQGAAAGSGAATEPSAEPANTGDESPAAKAQRLREALMVVAGGAGGGEGQPDAVAAGSERYVAGLLEEVVAPVVGACYENLLETEPQATGSIVLKLSLLGNESLGAVFVDVGFDGKSTLTQSSFRACLSDSLMALVLEAPPGERSQLSVTQVFDLEP